MKMQRNLDNKLEVKLPRRKKTTSSKIAADIAIISAVSFHRYIRKKDILTFITIL